MKTDVYISVHLEGTVSISFNIYNILPLQAEHFLRKKTPPPPVSKELLSYQKIKLTERQLHPPKQKMKTLKQNNKQIDKKKTVMK